MGTWFRVLGPQECPPGRVLERIVAGRVVAVVHTQDGAWHALDGVCPHQGGPLGAGSLCGTTLTCPWHGWQFDVADGQHRVSATVRQAVHEVKEEAGRLFVRLAAAGKAGGEA